jgi:hypothetical protein
MHHVGDCSTAGRLQDEDEVAVKPELAALPRKYKLVPLLRELR